MWSQTDFSTVWPLQSHPLYAVARPSVTLVHPTQPVEIVGNVSMPFGTLAIKASSF